MFLCAEISPQRCKRLINSYHKGFIVVAANLAKPSITLWKFSGATPFNLTLIFLLLWTRKCIPYFKSGKVLLIFSSRLDGGDVIFCLLGRVACSTSRVTDLNTPRLINPGKEWYIRQHELSRELPVWEHQHSDDSLKTGFIYSSTRHFLSLWLNS